MLMMSRLWIITEERVYDVDDTWFQEWFCVRGKVVAGATVGIFSLLLVCCLPFSQAIAAGGR